MQQTLLYHRAQLFLAFTRVSSTQMHTQQYRADGETLSLHKFWTTNINEHFILNSPMPGSYFWTDKPFHWIPRVGCIIILLLLHKDVICNTTQALQTTQSSTELHRDLQSTAKRLAAVQSQASPPTPSPAAAAPQESQHPLPPSAPSPFLIVLWPPEGEQHHTGHTPWHSPQLSLRLHKCSRTGLRTCTLRVKKVLLSPQEIRPQRCHLHEHTSVCTHLLLPTTKAARELAEWLRETRQLSVFRKKMIEKGKKYSFLPLKESLQKNHDPDSCKTHRKARL